MEMTTFAIENAYAEAIIRGFRASFFTDTQYTQIKNCSTLDELKSVCIIRYSFWKKVIMEIILCLTTQTYRFHS